MKRNVRPTRKDVFTAELEPASCGVARFMEATGDCA
jgi:hypothetical protein